MLGREYVGIGGHVHYRPHDGVLEVRWPVEPVRLKDSDHAHDVHMYGDFNALHAHPYSLTYYNI